MNSEIAQASSEHKDEKPKVRTRDFSRQSIYPIPPDQIRAAVTEVYMDLLVELLEKAQGHFPYVGFQAHL